MSDDERFLDMHNFQQDVNRLLKWCHVNRLSINEKKQLNCFFTLTLQMLKIT